MKGEVMDTATIRDARKIIEMGLDTNQSVILIGSPGNAKSAVIKQVAKARNIGCKIFEGSSLDPTDVRGILIPDKDQSYFTISPLLPNVKKDGERGILLIDELSSSLPATKIALQPLWHPDDRRLGEHKMPTGWIPMATGNLITDGSGVTSDSEAMKDRVLMLKTDLPYSDWKEDYALPNNLHRVVIGLLNFRNDLFNTFSKRNKSQIGKNFATARTWERVSEVLYYADKTDMPDKILMAAISGWVGDGPMSECIAFRNLDKKLPDPDEIISKGKNTVPKDTNILYALCAALVSKINSYKDKPKVVDRVLEYSTKLNAEFGMLLVRDMFVLYHDVMVKLKRWPELAMRYQFNSI